MADQAILRNTRTERQGHYGPPRELLNPTVLLHEQKAMGRPDGLLQRNLLLIEADLLAQQRR